MMERVIIAGAGIGGLAAGLACARAGIPVHLLEQSNALAEVGAGIQLGPNVVRVLHAWGLQDQLSAVAAFPQHLEVRNAISAKLLGVLPLAAYMQQAYGAPYVTIARADLHRLLLGALQTHSHVEISLNAALRSVEQDDAKVHLVTAQGEVLESGVLIGADGLWSTVRTCMLDDGAPVATGHLAFRAMLPQSDLPPVLRSQVVTAWLGPDFHVVQYPVRAGAYLNVVAIVKGPAPADFQQWNHNANAAELQALLANAGAPLIDLVHAVPEWRLWPLFDRVPMSGPAQHARGRVALLGDAAHPMRPYLAQGAGMAIEDAAALAQALASVSLAHGSHDVPHALQRYAQSRWRRNARVQARAIRNGQIFHLRGPLGWARDAALQCMGARLIDVPWLYSVA